MEIRFCDRCSESIPDSDFDAGRAVTVSGRHYHVACALTRSLALNGPRSWLAFLLALYAAGVATFLLVAALSQKEEPDRVTPVVEAAILKASKAAERNAAEETSRKVVAAKRENAQLRDAAATTLRDELRAQLDVLQSRVEESDQLASNHLTAQRERIMRLENEVSDLNTLLREIKEEAEREAARRATEPPPVAPEPPPKDDVEEPGTEPTPPTPPPTPPVMPREPGHDQEVERWIRRLKDSNENIRFSATLELGRLKDLRATQPLIEVLEKDRDYYVRLGAATALGDIKAVDAIPALIDALNDGDALVRTAANDALQAITEQQFEFVSEMTKSERRKVQRQWQDWFKANEAALRDRLGQPKTT